MPSTARIQDIERLRAIAALAVLVGHVPWLQAGLARLLHLSLDPWTGVDLFFVISGYVVSSAFERDLARAPAPAPARAALGAFYRKRAARILPTAYVGLALWWFGATWLNRTGAWGEVLTGADAGAMVASGVLFVSNYAEVFAGVTMPLFWYWSLCVEEHFYLLYPAFRTLVSNRRRRIVAVLSVIVLVQAARLWMSDPKALLVLSHTRFDQLAFGVLIGLIVPRRPAMTVLTARWRAPGRPRTMARLALVTLLIVLGALPATLLLDPAADQARVGYLLAGLCAAGIVALASCDADLLSGGRTRLGDALSVVGSRSFGLYMLHMPALWIVVEARSRWFADPGAVWLRGPELIAYVLVLAALVEANYRWVERPLVSWASRPRG